VARAAADWAFFAAHLDDARIKRAVDVYTPFVDATVAGMWMFLPLDREVLAVERPAMFHDEREFLHREDGPAMAWPSGAQEFFWRGVHVPEKVVMAPETLTPSEINKEANLEVRRIMLDRFGADRFMREVGATAVHSDEFGQLLRYQFGDDEPILMVDVVNSTPEPDGTFKNYMLRVDPQCRPLLPDGEFGDPQELTAVNAIGSTFGMTGAEYASSLVVQT
jgi:hypothetical protein